MSWRIVVIENQAKLSYKNGYMVVRGEDVSMIHLSEINTIIIDTTAASITAYLISELIKNKIKLIFCDEKRNPQAEMIPYYGAHDSSKKIDQQIHWDDSIKSLVWTKIMFHKIINQADHLKKRDLCGWEKLMQYVYELKINDVTNREGHAAKVYFNALFGKNFSREQKNDINAALDYGYSILLSSFNKAITATGYLTQIGLKHKNYFNQFNLTSDLMEPFRVYVDEIVYEHQNEEFNNQYKLLLIDLLNKKIKIQNKDQYLNNAITIYVKHVFKALEYKDESKLIFMEY